MENLGSSIHIRSMYAAGGFPASKTSPWVMTVERGIEDRYLPWAVLTLKVLCLEV